MMKHTTTQDAPQQANKKFKSTKIALLENFKPGDLLYGIENTENGREGARSNYRKILQLQYPDSVYLTVDRLNNLILPHLQKPQPAHFEKKLDPTLQAYWQHLKDFKKRDKKPIYDFENMQDVSEEKILKRLCKVAFFLQESHIHFCLDDINIEQVASSVSFNKHKQLYGIEKSFTAIELRFLCRHWDELSNKVTFYVGGEKVSPPWEANKESWVFCNKTEAVELVKYLNRAYQKGKGEGIQFADVADKKQFFLQKSITAYEAGLQQGLSESTQEMQKTQKKDLQTTNPFHFFLTPAPSLPPSPNLHLPQANLDLATSPSPWPQSLFLRRKTKQRGD